uniref:Nucleic acid binding protein n=1 Tax=Arundo donax TaxID=35708 RepID=A0A0A9CPI7_ARUDO
MASDKNIVLEEGQVEDMDLANNDVVVPKDQLLHASVQSETSVAAIQTIDGFDVKLGKGNGAENAQVHAPNNNSIEESRVLWNVELVEE